MTDERALWLTLVGMALGIGFMLGELNAMRRERKHREKIDRIRRGRPEGRP